MLPPTIKQTKSLENFVKKTWHLQQSALLLKVGNLNSVTHVLKNEYYNIIFIEQLIKGSLKQNEII